MAMKTRFPLFLLVGIVFLGLVSFSFGLTSCNLKCLQSCKSANRKQECLDGCRLAEYEEGKEEHEKGHYPEPSERPRGRQEGEEQEKKKEAEWKEHHRYEDPEERAREREKEKEKEEREIEREKEKEKEERKKEEKQRQEEKQEQQEEREEGEVLEGEKNPFHIKYNRFRTIFKNRYGHVRVLRRFHRHSKQLQNLRDYGLVELWSKPNTLFLPHHADADFILVIVTGKAILTLVNPDNSDSFNLELGDTIRIPRGTTFFLVNRDEYQNLRVIKLALPVNKYGKIQCFYPSNNEERQTYFRGFSKNVLEAAFDTQFEEIERVLLEGKQQGRGEQSQEEGIIVKFPKEKVEELRRHAKSSSRKIILSKNEPFNLRSDGPIYSNEFGKLYEVTPEKNPQLRQFDLLLTSLQMKEGGLFVPHYNTGAFILVVNEGIAQIELVGLGEQQQEQEEEEEEEEEKEQEERREVRRYRATLYPGDVFMIPASYPVSINATFNVRMLGFGIDGENNRRNLLAGERGNVIRQIHRQVKEVAFPGGAEDVEKLLKKQRESYFVDAHPPQKLERRNGALPSILGALY